EQTFILGKPVEDFEKAIATFCGVKHAIGVSSGTDAIQLALMVAGITQGDEVITTPFTFIATAEPIALLGAKPVFVDIDPRTFNIDPEKIEEKITKRTKAIIVVHLYGQAAAMRPILAIARKHNLTVIEDACQAIGAVDGTTKKQAGAIGAIGCFSFFPSKNLGGFGDGGLVTTDNEASAELIAKLRVHGSAQRYYHDEIGINARLDALQAVVLKVKLKYLAGWLKARRVKAEKYNELIDNKGLKDIIATPFVAPGNVHTYHQYTLTLLGKKASSKLRDDLCEHLRKNGIGSMVYYPVPLHIQKCFTYLGYKKGDYPISETCAQHVFSLPIFPELTDDEQTYIIDRIAGFLKA
ncbi:MAG: DegT/DnrJ/EryC1/StrS family aminotransferase, partial [Candidatus Omnitrophica bacterium]|nr:DegT/DnrJ/EryC1/StrS family aminotransferase [Candidatus Omnitrophota bacterium]